MTDNQNPKRVRTPVARLSYPHLFEKSSGYDGKDGKYQCELIFEPDADLSELRKAADIAAKEKWPKALPKKYRSPFRDGDEDREGKDGYEGMVFINAKSSSKPGVVVLREGSLDSPESMEEVYGGCFVRASVTAYAYDVAGNVGVAFALNSVVKVGDGDSFSSGVDAATEFADLGDGDSVGSDLI